MGVESSDDLAAFFSLDDFGTSATYLPSGGGSSTVIGIFDLEFVEILENDTGAAVEGRRPVLTCRTSDVSSLSHDDQFTINAVTYDVVGIEPTADGAVTKIILAEAA